ncbi:MAG: CBS domain-containing protein [Syntrophomonadaceae bacterium]|jgi:tRNA nucleotidyltransferase (CCA-adding enzyme)
MGSFYYHQASEYDIMLLAYDGGKIMEIITSHNALDFDGLASMVAAGRLYPGAVKVVAGTLSKNVKYFMALYKDLLEVKSPREVNLNKVERMIIVDTANINRLGHLKELAARENLDFHIYDHHPSAPGDIRGSINEIHSVGATTTILVEKLAENNKSITSFEATIFALGIYEDTGSMIFSSTTPRDVTIVSYLLARGANLSVVANFMEQPFSSEQKRLLHELLQSTRHYRINNLDVVIAACENKDFIPGLDMVTYRLLEMENSDVVFAVAVMQGKINIVSRSRTPNVRVNEVLMPLGGRGHEKAASAVIKGKDTEEIVELLLDSLKDEIRPGLLARDIMSTPVKSIPGHISMEEAERIMLRYGHTGMPVVDGGKIIGIISRRDVDKAKNHDLGHAPVKGFMSTGVITVHPDTTVNEIQRLMIEYDIGRLPVTEGDKITGIVSRTDILRTFHGDDCPDDHVLLYSAGVPNKENYAHLMETVLPANVLLILRLAGDLAQEYQYNAYCVGGFVRDLLLSVANFDIDLVVEGDSEVLANQLAEKTGGRVRIHERFGTAMVTLPDGTKIDIASARTEYYEFPAALPQVERSSIKEDLYRRDFTINTMAICLNPGRFGDLIDYFGGQRDLENKTIRVLYNLSFVEDPTRIIRAIRFEQRYNFAIDPDTLRFAQDAIERRMLGKLSFKRIMQELILILGEKDPISSLRRMEEIGVWDYVLPEVKLEKIDQDMIRRIPVVVNWWQNKFLETNVRLWLVYLLLMLSRVNQQEIEGIIKRFPFDNYVKKAVGELFKIPQILKEIESQPQLAPTDIDALIGLWNRESIILLLLHVQEEAIWDLIIDYLERKEQTSLKINGHVLKELGLNPGPQFRQVLDRLYRLKLNGEITKPQEEIDLVKKWLQEGELTDAVGD